MKIKRSYNKLSYSFFIVGQELNLIVHVIEQRTWIKRIPLNGIEIQFVLLVLFLEQHFFCLEIYTNCYDIVCHEFKGLCL